jgi:hypothetical protein
MKKLLGILLGSGGMVRLYFAADSAADADIARAEAAGIEVGEASEDFNWNDVRLPGFEVAAQGARDRVPLMERAVDSAAEGLVEVIYLSGNAVGKLVLLAIKAQIYFYGIITIATIDAFIQTDAWEEMFMGGDRERWRRERDARYAAQNAREAAWEAERDILVAAAMPGATAKEIEAAEALRQSDIFWRFYDIDFYLEGLDGHAMHE